MQKPAPKSILILLGGMWHDFAGFANTMKPVYENAGYCVSVTYDLDILTRLDHEVYTLILSYTCFTRHREGYDDTGPEKMTEAQVAGLTHWVRNGGGLLAAHAATAIGDSSPELGDLFGGVFISHPEPFSFTVAPMYGVHPIAANIPAFTVHDEFYIQKYDPSVEIHMVANYQGMAYPMVWSRLEDLGRVAHIAPGHFPEVWLNPVYQRLMLQAAAWLTEPK
jgi:type 1 glutamine amidotransferase